MTTKTKSIKTFIKQNRNEIDKHILRVCPNVKYLNDDTRQTWVMNDEVLYLWAKSEGVRYL